MVGLCECLSGSRASLPDVHQRVPYTRGHHVSVFHPLRVVVAMCFALTNITGASIEELRVTYCSFPLSKLEQVVVRGGVVHMSTSSRIHVQMDTLMGM